MHSELLARPVRDELQGSCRDAATACFALEPIPDFGSVVLTAEPVNADRAEQLARLGIDDDERRVGPSLPHARGPLDELDRVITRVWRRDARPARDLRVLARGGDGVDVVALARPQRDDSVVEAGNGEPHRPRVTERSVTRLRITGRP